MPNAKRLLTFPVATEINKRGYDTRSTTPETVEYIVNEIRAAQAALRAIAEGKE